MADITLVPEASEFDQTFLTETDLSSSQYFFVKLNSSERIVLCGAGDKPLGVLQDKPVGASGVPVACRVRVGGISKLKLAGTVSANSYVKADSASKGVATTTGNDEYGASAISSGESGDLIAVRLMNGRY